MMSSIAAVRSVLPVLFLPLTSAGQTPPPVRMTDPIRYTVPVPFGISPPFVGSTVGDFSGDGNPDICLSVDVLPTPTPSTASIRCFLSDGQGGFAGPIVSTLPATSLNGVMTNADFDLDGILDLIAGRYAIPTTVVLQGDGQGGFVPWGWAGITTFPDALALGDLDGDGDQDVVLTYGGLGIPVLEPAFNNGPGVFGWVYGTCNNLNVFLSSGGVTAQSALVDANQDGLLDYVSGNGVFAILPGLGMGCFANGSSSALWWTTGPPLLTNWGRLFAFGDFSGDGLDDIVMAVPYAASGPDIAVWLHGPSPSPSWSVGPTFTDPGCPLGVTTGDVDLDGMLDFVVSGTAPDTCSPATATGNRLVVYRNLGAGSAFQPIPFTEGYAWRPRHPVVTDVNADGWPDLLHDFVGVPGVEFPGFAVTLNAAAFQSPELIGLPVTGSTVHVYLEGASGAPWILLIAASLGGPLSFPGIQGSLLLDPASVVLLGYGTFPPDGNVNVPAPIPNDPSLVARRAVLQHLGVGPSGGTPAFGPTLDVVIR